MDRAPRRRRRGAIALTVSLAAMALLGASCSPSAAPLSPQRASATAPAVFAASRFNSTGLVWRVGLVSATTGKVEKVLTTTTHLTNNGMTISPDGRYVYFVDVVGAGATLEQLDTHSGRQVGVALGWEPTVSPNGKYLAYVEDKSDGTTVAVRELSTGATKTFDLTPIAGTARELIGGDLVWTGDGQRLVALPEADGTFGGPLPTTAAAGGTCGTDWDLVCVISFEPGVADALAHAIVLRGAPSAGTEVFSAGTAEPASVFVVLASPDKSVVEAMNASSTTLAETPIAVLPGVVLAFDPSGTNVLYLEGHPPPAVFSAALGQGRALGAKELVPNAGFDAYAW
jgi:hypothetical protein